MRLTGTKNAGLNGKPNARNLKPREPKPIKKLQQPRAVVKVAAKMEIPTPEEVALEADLLVVAVALPVVVVVVTKVRAEVVLPVVEKVALPVVVVTKPLPHLSRVVDLHPLRNPGTRELLIVWITAHLNTVPQKWNIKNFVIK